MPKLIPPEVKAEAIRLRVEERLSIDEIKAKTGLSVGTLSTLLRDLPLSSEEVFQKMSSSSVRNNPLRAYNPKQSQLAQALAGEQLTRERKGRIAETAVLLRLVARGYEVWHSQFDCHRVDWLVSRPAGDKYVRIQVRWARRQKWGRPLFMTSKKNRSPLDKSVCDFVVGYDLETDTAFVYPVEKVGQTLQSCNPEYAEAWHLLGI